MKTTMYDFSKYCGLSTVGNLKTPLLKLTERSKTADLYWSVNGMNYDKLIRLMVEKYIGDSFKVILHTYANIKDKKATGYNFSDYEYIPINAARIMFDIAAKAIEESLKIYAYYTNKKIWESGFELEQYLYTRINKNHLNGPWFVTLDMYLYKKDKK